MNYMEFANSPIMWAISGSAILVALFQCILFVRKALQTGAALEITKDQVKLAARASAISSIGPSLAIVGGMLPILVSLGGAISWIRIGLIGSVGYELMAAGFGATAAGSVLGGELTPLGYSNAVFAMSMGTVGYLLVTIFFVTKLDTLRLKIVGGKEALIPVVSAAAMIGAFSYLTMDQVFTYDTKRIVAVVAGFIIMSILCYFEKKKNLKWTKEWGITIAMFVGMFVAIFFK